MSYFPDFPYGDKIAQGLYTSIAPWSKIGYNAAVTTEQDIAPWLGAGSTPALTYLFPTAELTMTIVSSSAKDCRRAITAFANSATSPGVKTTVTCNGHGLANADNVIITGTTNYNGTYALSNVAANTFDIVKVYSVNDATGTAQGPGAGQVTVSYLDDTYTAKTATATLLGTTPVNIATDMFRVNNARVIAVGTSYALIGNITIANGGNTYGYITLGKTKGRQCVYTVPLGKTLYVNRISFSCGSQTASKHARFITRANYNDLTATVLGRNLFMPFHEILLNNTAFTLPLDPPTKLPATVDLKVSAYADSAAVVSCALRGYIITT